MRPTYEPPIARDISGLSAMGKKGPKPLSLCIAGHTIVDNSCVEGATVGSPGICDVGSAQGTNPQCSAGTSGSRGCISGHLP